MLIFNIVSTVFTIKRVKKGASKHHYSLITPEQYIIWMNIDVWTPEDSEYERRPNC